MSKFKLFDVHTHVQFAAFEKDYKEAIDRALKNGIALVNVGTQKHTSAKAVEVAGAYPSGVYAAVGLHPIHTSRSYHDSKELEASFSDNGFAPLDPESHSLQVKDIKRISSKLDKNLVFREGNLMGFESRGEEFDYEYYKNLADNPKTVAIGECGLDYYRLEPETKQKQFEAFEAQIDLSKETAKPLMIHCRSAFDDLIKILNSKSYILNSSPGIIHFFSGSKENAAELLSLGFSFSFGGVITFTRDYDEVLEYLPLENIVLETDAPYVAPVPYRGKRNEPSYIIETAKKIAELKNISLEEIAEITTMNVLKIFKIAVN
ncbi:MAG: TatD family hydrolase [Patescibacteria group bacterium]